MPVPAMYFSCVVAGLRGRIARTEFTGLGEESLQALGHVQVKRLV